MPSVIKGHTILLHGVTPGDGKTIRAHFGKTAKPHCQMIEEKSKQILQVRLKTQSHSSQPQSQTMEILTQNSNNYQQLRQLLVYKEEAKGVTTF